MNLRIRPDLSVSVSVPYRYGRKEAEDFVRAKAGFIAGAQDKLRERRKCLPCEPACTDGETMRLRGRTMTLRVCEGTENEVSQNENCLVMRVKRPEDAALRRRVYERWLAGYTQAVFEEKCRDAYAALRGEIEIYPEIRIRKMTSRWGSCNKTKRVITLNKRLIEADDACIAYVALHEMCHMVYPNHQKEFHALMDALMPDSKIRKRILNESVILR